MKISKYIINFLGKTTEKVCNSAKNLADAVNSYFTVMRMDKGEYGEYLSESSVSSEKIEGYKRILHNIYIPTKNGTTEIDVLLIHEKGIFVIESKNYSGWIYGEENNDMWVHTFPNGEKFSFYNPIKQNEAHCAALSSFLNIQRNEIYSYIVFSDDCKFKKVPADTDKYRITRFILLREIIRYDLYDKNNIFTQDNIDEIADKLQIFKKTDDLQKQHIDYINEKYHGMYCPKCGSKLVVRNGKYGEFYGCGAYPKCRYTRDIDE